MGAAFGGSCGAIATAAADPSACGAMLGGKSDMAVATKDDRRRRRRHRRPREQERPSWELARSLQPARTAALLQLLSHRLVQASTLSPTITIHRKLYTLDLTFRMSVTRS